MFEKIRVAIENFGTGRARQRDQLKASIDRVTETTSEKLTEAVAANMRATDENARVKFLLESLLRDVRSKNLVGGIG